MSYRDLPRLAAFVIEAKAVLVAGVVEVFAFEFGNGTNLSGGMDQDGDDRRISKPDDVGCVDRLEKLSGLFHGDLGGFALDNLVAVGTDGCGGVENDCVAGDETFEKVAEASQDLLLAGCCQRLRVQVVADVGKGDCGEFK